VRLGQKRRRTRLAPFSGRANGPAICLAQPNGLGIRSATAPRANGPAVCAHAESHPNRRGLLALPVILRPEPRADGLGKANLRAFGQLTS
jgi:hypothetical protein